MMSQYGRMLRKLKLITTARGILLTSKFMTNSTLSNFVVWFSICSSLVVITDEGRNPETEWLWS